MVDNQKKRATKYRSNGRRDTFSRGLLAALLCWMALAASAQYRVDRLVRAGQSALYYEDYVLSIQYFNQAILSKPYLYQPWWYRGMAKYNLDDFSGAEKDVSEAIKLNPYIEEMYDLRAVSRIRQENYRGAISDYTRAIALAPRNQRYWYNRAVCRMNDKEYAQAALDLDTIMQRWSDYADAYTLRGQVALYERDTTQAAQWLDKSLQLDPYNANAWEARSMISVSRQQWRDADKFLTKTIGLKPREAGLYINRALARININNLSGAMTDYDMALDIDPNNFLAHYNRGLLRMQLGDNNRAITDFDYVVKMEPNNFMAIFNRGILRDKTGDLRGAISDYSRVIATFPNFWTGLSYRANCYRRLGMTAKAEMDEFRIFKAQMNKHVGIQPRWSNRTRKLMRKRSEIDPEKYNQIVVDDEPKPTNPYKSKYRGRVQDRDVELAFLPMFQFSYLPYANGLTSYQAYDAEAEQFNSESHPRHKIYLACSREQLNEAQSLQLFQLIDTLSAGIKASRTLAVAKPLLMQRAVAYAMLNSFDEAIDDLTSYLQIDSTSVMARWQRGVCQAMVNDFNASQGLNDNLKAAGTLADFDLAVRRAPRNAYLYYDRGNLYARREDYNKAIDNYTQAIQLDGSLAEAWYNRGIAQAKSNNKKEAISDLSRAGELGLYDAYAVIKRLQ